MLNLFCMNSWLSVNITLDIQFHYSELWNAVTTYTLANELDIDCNYQETENDWLPWLQSLHPKEELFEDQ